MAPFSRRVEAGLMYLLTRLPDLDRVYDEAQAAIDRIGTEHLSGRVYLTSTAKTDGRSYARYLYRDPRTGRVRHVKKSEVAQLSRLTANSRYRTQAVARQREVVGVLKRITDLLNPSIGDVDQVLKKGHTIGEHS